MEEEYDLIDSESIPVVGVENFNVARDVIKSLRSSSNSNRFYKQNATRDNFLIENLDEFNKVVTIKATTLAVAQSQEDKLNESITNFKPPIRYIVPKHTNTNNGKILYNPNPITTPAASSKDYDDFSSDDEKPYPSPNKLNKSPKYDDGDEYDLKADSSDDDNSWNTSSKSKSKSKNYNSPPQNNLPKASHKSRMGGGGDDDLDFGEDDDEADNAELFACFTAPVSNSSKHKNYSTTTRDNAGSSTVVMSKSAKMNGTSSIKVGKSGSAGIRGIQELLKEPNAFNSRSQSPAVNLLSSIKPGQAIRVKAPGKRRNSNGEF